MINTARAMKMKVMLGCMIVASVGITAGAQISPLVVFADLDGILLITNDPFEGVKVKKGKLILPGGCDVFETSINFPPSIFTSVASSSSGVLVFKSTIETAAIEASASPLKPSVCIFSRSS